MGGINFCRSGDDVKFKPDMLSWLFAQQYDQNPKEHLPGYLVNALLAMTQLHQFDFKVALMTIPEKEILMRYDGHFWGSISFNQVEIISFDYSCFGHIYEWPEIDNHDIVKSWTVDDWYKFFITKIEQQSKNDCDEAETDFNEKIASLKEAMEEVTKTRERFGAIKQALKFLSE